MHSGFPSILLTLALAVCLVGCADAPTAPTAADPPTGGKADDFSNADELIELWEASLEDVLEHPDTSRFEASGVAVHDNRIYVAFDNLRQFASFDLDFLDPQWLGDPDGYGVEDLSDVDDPDDLDGFEGITVDDSGRVTLAVEALETEDGDYRAALARWDLEANEPIDISWIDHEFEDLNSGVEGVAHLDFEGTHYIVSLCEAGKCDDRTRGRLLLQDDSGELTELDMPRDAEFDDYSGLAIRGDQIAVASQESSVVWFGRIRNKDGELDLVTTEVFAFERQDDGDVDFCNVEGIAWLTEDVLVAVSDLHKDDQPNRCRDHSESVHIFLIP